jgi:hypothetical protein
MSIQNVSIHLVGTTPLVMHNNQCVNPLNHYKKSISAITAKGKKKTDADFLQLAKLEFFSGLYINDHLGPFVPGHNIRKMLIEAARKEKNGKQFEAGCYVDHDAAVIYEGPKTKEEMFALGDKFVWTCVVGNQQSSIMRTRPRFENWELDFTITYENELLSVDSIKSALYYAKLCIGLCDGRSIGCGRFNYALVESQSPVDAVAV